MAIDSFLVFKDAQIKGEAPDKDFGPKGAFHVLSFSFSVAQKGTAATGTGVGTGKAEFEDFSFEINTQQGSPRLMMACASGKHIEGADLFVRKAGGKQEIYLKYEFKDLIISSYETSGDEESKDTIKFAYTAVKACYGKQDAKGKVSALDNMGGFDLKKNDKWT